MNHRALLSRSTFPSPRRTPRRDTHRYSSRLCFHHERRSQPPGLSPHPGRSRKGMVGGVDFTWISHVSMGTRHADVNLPALVGFNAPLKQPHLYPPSWNVHHLPLYFTLVDRPRHLPYTACHPTYTTLQATSIPVNPLTTPRPTLSTGVLARARFPLHARGRVAPCARLYARLVYRRVWYQNGRELQW